jgi:hypothetical protein
VHFSNEKIDLDSKNSNGSPGSSSHSQFRMELMEILGRPYTKEEYEVLLHEVSYKKPLEHQRILRGRTISYALDSFGKSYLDQYPGKFLMTNYHVSYVLSLLTDPLMTVRGHWRSLSVFSF